MEALEEGKLLENSFEDPLFNIWSYLSPRDLVRACRASKEVKEKSIFGFIANEIFAGFNLPLVFDNAADYDLEQLLLQIKRYSVPHTPSAPAEQSLPQASQAPPATEAVPAEEEEEEDSPGMFLVERRLESASFDEYDDFTPRHPVPKDKVHRRGDSYFNSDIAEAARLAADPTVSAAIRKFAIMTLKTERCEEEEVEAVISPHVPTFRNSDSAPSKDPASVFTFE